MFDANNATYGGALHVADETTSGTCSAGNSHSPVSECFFQTSNVPKFSGPLDKKSYQPMYHPIHTRFRNNHALGRGSNLFGGLFDRCILSPFNQVNGQYNVTKMVGLEYLQLYSNISTSIDSISSEPFQVCFCYQNRLNCQKKQFHVEVRRGERFEVPLAAIDQAENIVSATIHKLLKSNGSRVEEREIQSVSESCTNLTYNVFSPHKSQELILYADGPCKDAPLSQRKVLIKFLPCNCTTGFQIKQSERTNCVCECDSKLNSYISSCDCETKTMIKRGNFWITYIQNIPTDFSDYVIFPHCPLDYCKDHSENVNITLNTEDGINEQCAWFRKGLLCGSCQSNVTLSIGSSRCIVCPDYWPANFIIILICSVLAGIILVALILLLNLTVAIGTLNGIVFYANIINANIRTFFPSSKPTFFSVFISWLNLDIGLDICLFPGMDAYFKTWLQLCAVSCRHGDYH